MCPTPSKVSSQLTKTTGCYVTCAFTNMPSYINKRRKNALYFACLLHVGPFNYFSEGSAVVQMFSSSKNSKFLLRGEAAFFKIKPNCEFLVAQQLNTHFCVCMCVCLCVLGLEYSRIFKETEISYQKLRTDRKQTNTQMLEKDMSYT